MAGIIHNDRELGAEVRRMSLKKVRKILSDDYEDKDYQKAVLLKLVPTLLPRLNEIGGEGGGAIKINLVRYGDNNTLSVLPPSVSDEIVTRGTER